MNRRALGMRFQLLIAMLTLPLLLFVPIAANASTSYILHDAAVTIDGEPIEFDAPLRMSNDRLFAPVAPLASAFKAKVSWDADNEEVTIRTADDNTIVLGIGVPVVYYNEARYRMDAAPFIEEGRTYLPVRAAAELLRANVKWNSDDLVAALQPVPAEEEFAASIFENEAEPFSEDDLMLLAKITQVEAGYESYEGQLAVANVILNRVKDERFPNSIKEVIYSGNQFPPAHNGLLDRSEPNASVLRAAKDALNGKNNVEDAVYFYNPRVTKGKFWSSLEVVKTIGGHRFAR